MLSSANKARSRHGKLRVVGILGLMILLVGILVACQPAAAPAPAAEEAAAEATEAPAEEAAEAEATEAPAEEAAAEATEAPAEEAAAEATEEPAEEAAAEATEEPAEEMADDGEMDAVALGGYIVTLAGGCGCHMNNDLDGLAGGREFETDAGLVYASNITPDVETGIGGWTAEGIASALQIGIGSDGEQLATNMPYMRYSLLSDHEALAVGSYLLSLDPISNAVTETVLSEAPAAYTPANASPAEASADPVVRGEQLVGFINCGGCHTPRDTEGMLLAGNMLREEYAKNITPDEATGIGSWSAEEIASYLTTGTRPDGSQVEGAMASQIERRFHALTAGDAAAIAAYLMSIPAVENAAPSE